MNKAKRKNILIDLSDLKHPNCGFGQIAINYSTLIPQHYYKIFFLST